MGMQKEPLRAKFMFSLAILDPVPLALLESSSAYHLLHKVFRVLEPWVSAGLIP